MRLSCELKNYIALRRKELHSGEIPQDRQSSLARDREVSPDAKDQRTSVHSRSGQQSLTENTNAITPRSVRGSGGPTVLSPRLTEGASTTSTSTSPNAPSEMGSETENGETESNHKPRGCCGRKRKKIEDATEQDLSAGFDSEVGEASRESKPGPALSTADKQTATPDPKVNGRRSAGNRNRMSSVDKTDKPPQRQKGSFSEPTSVNRETMSVRQPSAFESGTRIGAPFNQAPVSSPVGVVGGCAGADGLCRCSLMSANQQPYMGSCVMSPQSPVGIAVPASYELCPAAVNCQSPQGPTYPTNSAPQLDKERHTQPAMPEIKRPSSPKSSFIQPRISVSSSPAGSQEEEGKKTGKIVCGDYEESTSKNRGSSRNTSTEGQTRGGCCFCKKRNAKPENSEDSSPPDALAVPPSQGSVGSHKDSLASDSVSKGRPSGRQRFGSSLFGGRMSRNAKPKSNEDSPSQKGVSSYKNSLASDQANKGQPSGKQRPGGYESRVGGTVAPNATICPTPVSNAPKPCTPVPNRLNTPPVSFGGVPAGRDTDLGCKEYCGTPVTSLFPNPGGQVVVGNECRMCPLHCRAFMCPNPDQLTTMQPTHAEPVVPCDVGTTSATSPAPSGVDCTPPVVTSQNMLVGAGTEVPSHTVEIQFQGPRMSAVAVSEANGTSNQPIVRTSFTDFSEHSDAVPKSAAAFSPSGAAFTPPGVTSQKVLAGAGTEAPTHTVEIQFHGERMSAVTVAMANAVSHRPSAYASAVDAIEQSEKSRSETAALSSASSASRSLSKPTEGGSDTVSRLDEQQKEEEEEDSAGRKCCCCKRKRKPADNEGKEGEALTNEEATGAPEEGQPGQKRSWFSCCKKQPSNQAENETASKPTESAEAPEEGQSGQKRSCFSCRKKQPPSDQAEDETASKPLAGRDTKVSTKAEVTEAPEEGQPGQKRSCFSYRKKQPSDQAETETPGKMLSTTSDQSSLRLASAYVGDDGRRPESAQPFEYTHSRSLPYSLAAPTENGLPCPGLEASTHTAELKSQGPRLSPVNATAARARLNQPAFHSPVTDLTEQCDSTRPWRPPCPPEEGREGRPGQRYQNASPRDPTTQSHFIIGQSERRTPPVSPSTPECAGQTVVVNTPENSLASHGNRTTVECSLEAPPQAHQGFGQQRQLGLNGISRCQCSVGECLVAPRHPCPRIRPLGPPPQNGSVGSGQTVWVLMPMSMGANGMFGLPAPCSCHGRR
ncbi:hypothetical protein SprV_0501931900 [Sparganum proliferum]